MYSHIQTFVFVAIGAIFVFSSNGLATEADVPYGKICNELLNIAYVDGEKLTYDISWSGGIKIGELHLEIKKSVKRPGVFKIRALVTTDNGIFSYIYPVKDTHITSVSGEERLPFRYEVWQKEGRNYEAHRVSKYNQKKKQVWYWHNTNPRVIYKVSGFVHNEFSSFFSTRVMDLKLNHPFIVPTFADHKRNEVVVEVMALSKMTDTIFGDVDTIEVMPIMKFEGLYDKRGDTTIWFTNDDCRVPVKINSKIVIGSLTSELVAWENPSCKKYKKVIKKK